MIIDSLITGKERYLSGRIFYKSDISEKNILKKIFDEHPDISITIHCAGLIIVPESASNPLALNVCVSNPKSSELKRSEWINVTCSSERTGFLAVSFISNDIFTPLYLFQFLELKANLGPAIEPAST